MNKSYFGKEEIHGMLQLEHNQLWLLNVKLTNHSLFYLISYCSNLCRLGLKYVIHVLVSYFTRTFGPSKISHSLCQFFKL